MLGLPAPAPRQAPAPAVTPAPSLSEFEGRYDYHQGGSLFLVASGKRLVAVLGEGKYPLRVAGVDAFTNSGGDRIPFLRDAKGKVMAFQEKGETFRRRSPLVPEATRAMLEPRPRGEDGQPVAYRGLLRAEEPALPRLVYESYANPDPRKARVTLRDLLSHESGFACDDHDAASPGNEVKLYEAVDWARAFVDLPMAADPGTAGRYCSGGILAAGRIVEGAVGKPLPDFAQEVLFEPLGLRRAPVELDHSRRMFTPSEGPRDA